MEDPGGGAGIGGAMEVRRPGELSLWVTEVKTVPRTEWLLLRLRFVLYFPKKSASFSFCSAGGMSWSCGGGEASKLAFGGSGPAAPTAAFWPGESRSRSAGSGA